MGIDPAWWLLRIKPEHVLSVKKEFEKAVEDSQIIEESRHVTAWGDLLDYYAYDLFFPKAFERIFEKLVDSFSVGNIPVIAETMEEATL